MAVMVAKLESCDLMPNNMNNLLTLNFKIYLEFSYNFLESIAFDLFYHLKIFKYIITSISKKHGYYINLFIDVFCKVDGSQATKINSLGYGSKLIHKIWHLIQNNKLT